MWQFLILDRKLVFFYGFLTFAKLKMISIGMTKSYAACNYHFTRHLRRYNNNYLPVCLLYLLVL